MPLKDWERRGKRTLTRAVGAALKARGAAPEAPPDLAGLERILLVRQQNQLGDMLLGTPLFKAVRRRAPEARVDLVTGPPNHEPVRLCRFLDDVVLYDKAAYRRSPREARRFARRLRDTRYDLVLVISTVSFSTTSAWLAALAGARWRAGRPGPDAQGRDVARDVYHWTLPEPVPGRHQTGVNLDLVTPFGAPDDDWRPEIDLEPSLAGQGSDALTESLGEPDATSKRIVLHPGAGKKPNRWPAERFGALARSLTEAGHRVVLAAGPGEADLFAGVDAGAGRTLPRLPGMPLHAVGGSIRSADFLLANDTGVLHLGASVATPTLTFFGPTDPAQWCPAVPEVRYLRGGDGSVASIETDTAVRAAREMLEALDGGPSPVTAHPAPSRPPEGPA